MYKYMYIYIYDFSCKLKISYYYVHIPIDKIYFSSSTIADRPGNATQTQRRLRLAGMTPQPAERSQKDSLHGG